MFSTGEECALMERANRTQISSRRARRGNGKDAIALLKSDHRHVEKWFGEFKKAKSVKRKADLAGKICNALKVHTMIEEEIFYPAFLAATDDREIHHEAEVEHAGAKKLIVEIEALSPGDEYYDAKVSVLSEMIRHHVKEEEKPGGMFSEARKSDMDLDEIGLRLKAKKEDLVGKVGSPSRVRPGLDS
jgi:hemerythrin superfamily protein